MIITLIGYMGAGKSTVGRKLAEILEYTFLDLDDYIEEKEGASIKDIFKEKGEIYFRKAEMIALEEIQTTKNKIIVSVGGGTPCYGNNMEIINANNSVSFYLKLSPQYLAERLFLEKEHRPLISHLETKEALQEFIAIHLFERQEYYQKASHVVHVEKLSIPETVATIIERLY